jgi:hypothetical protein
MKTPAYSYRALMITAVLLILFGWPALYLLLITSLPTVGPRWFFFFTWAAASTGTALPFVWLLNRRFSADDPAPPGTLLREGLLFGLYAATCMWLQMNRSLTLSLGLLLGIGFLAVEWLLRYFEQGMRRAKQ